VSPASATRCPRCGAIYGAEARYCVKDGTRLVAADVNVIAEATTLDAMPAGGGEGGGGGGRRGRGSRREPRVGDLERLPTPQAPPVGAQQQRPGGGGAPRGSPPPPTPPRPATPDGDMVGQILDGRYRILKKIGEGGMSVVYLANALGTDATVAIKILSPALASDQNAMARLRREASMGVKLEHPNIAHIIRLGESDGITYVVMPYVEGELLSDRRHRLGQLFLEDTVRFVRDIAAGLHHAHEMKIVHRDLKPENVMITKARQPAAAAGKGAPGAGGGGAAVERAVVMDFGLAKERKAGPELEKLTATGIVLGTPEFMSPEQLRGKPLDGRTDVYSLALMAYEMLTGRLPFMGRTQHELMINRLRDDPVPIREMRPDLEFPAAVERVLLKGMARDAADRYQTAPAFAEALAEAAEGGEAGFIGRLFKR
jgi:serine/threonine-protein kinase